MFLGLTKKAILGLSLTSTTVSGGSTFGYLFGKLGVSNEEGGVAKNSNNLDVGKNTENFSQQLKKEEVKFEQKIEVPRVESFARIGQINSRGGQRFNNVFNGLNDREAAFNLPEYKEEEIVEDQQVINEQQAVSAEVSVNHEEVDPKVKQVLEELLAKEKARRRELAKQQKQDIWLEVAWFFKVAGIGRQKVCSLVKKGHDHYDRKRIPITINDYDNNRMFRDLCDQTVWSKSKNKDLKDNGYEDLLWIRGKHEAVKKTIWWNWEDISGFRWTNTVEKPHLQVSENLDELSKDFCQIKRDNDWTEVKCFNKKEDMKSRFPAFDLTRNSWKSLTY
ncbi:hypothetical protein [Mycoplasma parvum]|uniref:Uncharacterized protein n=1 Tax=Mycoplasma parvum str. Indiana TaxID=1403316 RepID=U5ND01_9MOLU|nr:hypothetical protein [Mycoplasma parvum]AGX89302.1 hypothetical protein PRV_02880 [Mycoplasma parvum str. Indiana]